MKKNTMKTQLINWLDLVYEILKYWRIALIFAIVFCLGTGYVGYKLSFKKEAASQKKLEQYNAEKDETTLSDEIVFDVIDGMTDEEFATFSEEITNYSDEELGNYVGGNQRTNVYLAEAYMKEYLNIFYSVHNSVNEDYCPVKQLVYTVSSDNYEKSVEICNAYIELLSGNDLYMIADESLKINFEKYYDYFDVSKATEGNSFTVTVKLTEELTEDWGNIIRDCYLPDKKVQLSEIYGEHSLNLISDSFAHFPDKEMLRAQTEEYQRAYNNMIGFWELVKNFSAYQIEYFDRICTGWYIPLDYSRNVKRQALTAEAIAQKAKLKPVEEVADSKPPKLVHHGYKAIEFVLGAIIGLAIYSILIFFKYLFNKKIRVTDDTLEMFGLYSFGILPDFPSKGLFKGIDKAICKLRFINKRIFDSDTTAAIATSNICEYLKKNSKNDVCIVVNEYNGRTKEFSDFLQNSLKKKGINCEIVENPLYKSQNITQLCKYENAVLMETAGFTYYSEICLEQDLFELHNINNIGIIVVEQ